MTISTRFRFGSLAAAAAIVAGGFFASAPANAATGSITLANTTYTAGRWGSGLDVTGAGFSAGAVVTVSVVNSNSAVIDAHPVTADASGAFHEVYTPSGVVPLPEDGETVSVTAVSDKGDTANDVALDIRAPKGIWTNVTTITTADLVKADAGFEVYAAGFRPGESVVATVDYAGQKLSAGTATAGRDGSVAFMLYMVSGVATAGRLTVNLVGVDSQLGQSVALTVTGADVGVGTPKVEQGKPAPSTSGTGAKKSLPVVSG
jgi:hypothetical protein